MKAKKIKTKFRAEQEARDLKIYNEYMKLISNGAMKTAANNIIKSKYGFHADSTIWFIRKRVEGRLKKIKK